jgi:hypothetical protein
MMYSNLTRETRETTETQRRGEGYEEGPRRQSGDMWRIEGRNRRYQEIFAEILRAEIFKRY